MGRFPRRFRRSQPSAEQGGQSHIGSWPCNGPRIVRNMDGQLRLKSEEGKGSRFVVQLPFMLPVDESTSMDEKISSLKLSIESPPIATPPPPAGEVTLIDRGSSLRAEGIILKRSIEEIASLHSFKSGSSNKSNKSTKIDVDRLIDAISTHWQLVSWKPKKGACDYQTVKLVV